MFFTLQEPTLISTKIEKIPGDEGEEHGAAIKLDD